VSEKLSAGRMLLFVPFTGSVRFCLGPAICYLLDVLMFRCPACRRGIQIEFAFLSGKMSLLLCGPW